MPDNTPSEAYLGLLHAEMALQSASAKLDQAVVEARAAGISWATIGEAVGMSRQSAHERWRVIDMNAETERLGQPLADGEDEALARSILAKLYVIHDPTNEQVAIAAHHVRYDPAGSRILASGGPIPGRRPDLRTARSEGRYLQGV